MIKSIFKGILISTIASGQCYAKPYEANSITVKPVGINFYSYTQGLKNISSRINGYKISVFKNAAGTLPADHPSRNAYGYDLEIGYMLTDYIEGFLDAGFAYETPHKKVSIATDRGVFTAFDFKHRKTYSCSIGGRYYFDWLDSWSPFMGLRIGVLTQTKTKASVYDSNANSFVFLGKIIPGGKKTMMNGSLQGGIDYHFTKMWHITFLTGIKYNPRSNYRRTQAADRIIKYKDNWNKWMIPFSISIKIVF